MAATTSPYAANELVGKWVLFIGTKGVVSYGLCTSNSTTTISISTPVNGTLVAEAGTVIILGSPVLDFAPNLEQGSPVSTFTVNKARSTSLNNCYEMDDKSDLRQVITKVVVKAKSAEDNLANTDNVKKTIAVTYSAKDEWLPEENNFENTSSLTKRYAGVPVPNSEGTYYSGYIKLKGTNYSFQSGDKVYCIKYSYTTDNGVEVPASIRTCTLRGVATEVPISGKGFSVGVRVDYEDETTILSASNASLTLDTDCDIVINSKIYVKDYVRVLQAEYDQTGIWVGTEPTKIYVTNASSGNDPIFGGYLYIATENDILNIDNVFDHFIGCPVTNDRHEVTADTLSPIGMFGVIENTITPDSGVNIQQLESQVLKTVTSGSFYYHKGTFWCMMQDWFKSDMRYGSQVCEAGWIREGDMIAILQKTGDTITDVQYNQYKNLWQVVQWTFDTSTMKVTVELGDYERNIVTTLISQTTATQSTIT
jgi:hypothetical protein